MSLHIPSGFFAIYLFIDLSVRTASMATIACSPAANRHIIFLVIECVSATRRRNKKDITESLVGRSDTSDAVVSEWQRASTVGTPHGVLEARTCAFSILDSWLDFCFQAVVCLTQEKALCL